MSIQERFTARPYAGEADLQPICDLLNHCTVVDQVVNWYATPEEFARDLAAPGLDVSRDVRLWDDAAGRLVGYGQVGMSRPGEGDAVDALLRPFLVHPAARQQGLEAEIIGWATERVRAVAQERGQSAAIGTYFREGTPEYSADRRGILQAQGFTPVRRSLKMARSLNQPFAAPQLPEGFTLRPIAGPAEVAPWTECYNASFIDSWNFHPATVEDWLSDMTDPHFEAANHLIACAPDGTFAAFCACIIDAADNTHYQRQHGDINLVGTRRGYRRQGLGRAMLLAAMHRLKAAGMDTATLWVDAENPTGAVHLYESVGFETTTVNVTYRKDL